MNRVTDLFWRAVDLPFKFAAVLLITLYRYTLSAFVGRSCRHLPTCSEYTRDAIWQFGFWPGGTHGYDPVPEAVPERGRWYAPWRYGRWR